MDLSFSYFTQIFAFDLLLLLPEIYLGSVCLALLLFGVAAAGSREFAYPLLGPVLTRLLCLHLGLTLFFLLASPFESFQALHGTFLQNEGIRQLKILALCVATLLLGMYEAGRQKDQENYFEFPILLGFALWSGLFLLSSNDFLLLYLAVEAQSLCFYVLAAWYRGSAFSTEAGLKYFVLGALSSGILVFGISLLYGTMGTLSYEKLQLLFAVSETNPLETVYYANVLLAVLCILVGFLFKITAAPFHMWAPDVYEGAPTSITAFFVTLPKIVLLGTFARLLYTTFFSFFPLWQGILVASSILSMAVGSYGALAQSKLKRVLAFSSIGHMGYMLLALAAGSTEGLAGVFLYLTIYVFTSLGVFAILLSLENYSLAPGSSSNSLQRLPHGSSNSYRSWFITDLQMLSETSPYRAASFTILLFAMIGVPPLLGFFGKYFAFLAAVQASLILPALLGVCFSTLGAVYYLRLIKIMYFDRAEFPVAYKEPLFSTAYIFTLAVFIILWTIFSPEIPFLNAEEFSLSLYP
uniref:NADH dehydrogenase subunit 2 n=1 Tax=Prasinococcus sp. CCMP1194 TaxID=110672 RepID=A0A650AKJ8_9VIRI|nr:NADH dehydrogenase subunit 2 [Prasinococcus sp. CCMP1194]